MAEIGIEKKKPVWPWIILVLVILAILYFIFFANDDNDQTDDVNTEQVEDTTAWNDGATDIITWTTDAGDKLAANHGQSVQGYLSHVGGKSRMGVDHK